MEKFSKHTSSLYFKCCCRFLHKLGGENEKLSREIEGFFKCLAAVMIFLNYSRLIRQGDEEMTETIRDEVARSLLITSLAQGAERVAK
jgi:hypothetical protein